MALPFIGCGNQCPRADQFEADAFVVPLVEETGCGVRDNRDAIRRWYDLLYWPKERV